jgi:hypothetical protein
MILSFCYHLFCFHFCPNVYFYFSLFHFCLLKTCHTTFKGKKRILEYIFFTHSDCGFKGNGT